MLKMIFKSTMNYKKINLKSAGRLLFSKILDLYLDFVVLIYFLFS